MAHANWRLDNPPVVDVAVSRRMGLFVVARLAARHGIRVRLRPAATGGLIALVWLPDEAITHAGLGTAGNPGGSDSAMAMPDVVARSLAEGSLAGSRRGPGWVTTGSPPSFRTVPRPADEAGPAPGETGPNPVVSPDEPVVSPDEPVVSLDEELLAGPGDESAGAGPQATGSFPFGIGEEPASQAADDLFAAVLSPADDAPDRLDADPWSSAAVVPPAGHFDIENRLPIFEAVESDWFRQGGQATIRFGSPVGEASHGWSSPADEGWRAAEVVNQPSSAGITSAGLPKRVPRANLVPGAAAASEAGSPAPAPTRSAAATRDRFSSFQQGARRGRAAADGEEDGEGGG